jgi:hypothetical protein
MSSSKDCARMTIRNLDDVERYLNGHLLPRTTVEVDQRNLAKCIAIVRALALRDGDIKDLVRQTDERLNDALERVKSEYGE